MSSTSADKKTAGVHLVGRACLIAAGLGLPVGLAVAIPMTLADWRLNPSGIFRDADGTNWSIVIETALSWFVPVFLLVVVTALALIVVLPRLRRSGLVAGR